MVDAAAPEPKRLQRSSSAPIIGPCSARAGELFESCRADEGHRHSDRNAQLLKRGKLPTILLTVMALRPVDDRRGAKSQLDGRKAPDRFPPGDSYDNCRNK
jgi:hypothetical protein